MMKRKIVAGVAALGIAIALAGCSAGGRGDTGSGGGSGDNKGALVGVAMPTAATPAMILRFIIEVPLFLRVVLDAVGCRGCCAPRDALV